MNTKFCSENCKGKDHLVGMGINRKVRLKWSLEEHKFHIRKFTFFKDTYITYTKFED